MKTILPASLKFCSAIALWLTPVSAVVAQSGTSNSIPVVTIQATDDHGTWAGDPAIFTVFRGGNPAVPLNVFCCISGTASNGVDYQAIGNFVSLAAGVISNTIVINPINLGQTNSRTVEVDLCPSPALNPVNYIIGSPSNAVVFITPPGATNLPPAVSIVNPTNGAMFTAPANISLLARAADPDGTVTNVEFFAGDTDLGRGLPVVLDPPGVNGVTGLVYFFNWQNIPANAYSLTAVATDNGGLSTTSAAVNITVALFTNLPPVVRITSPPNDSVFRAPMDIPIYAYAFGSTDPVAAVEFFANGSSLGFGQHVTAVPPPLPPGPVQPPILIVAPTNYWDFVWTNPPPGTNIALTAAATDSGGLVTTSAPVWVSILPPLPPPTNRPALVSIVATDPIAIEGTNCWTWPGPISPVATWSNWFAAGALWHIFTNCGPKDATFTVFRSGATNNALTVAYSTGGTATNGVDYVALPGTVTVPAGQQSAAITLVPLDDGAPDINRTVVLRLIADATGTNYLLGYPRAAGAIILDSQSPRAVTGLTGAAFNLAAAGPDGAWFHVEYSSDIIHWTPICTNQVVNGCIDFVDPDAATNPARFYRAVPEAEGPQ
jgi:hypothetical protein